MATPAPAEQALHKRTLGVKDLVFFMVAASGPLLVVAGALPVGYLGSGNAGLPLLLLIVGTVLALFAGGYAAMSRHVTNAGAFYAYIAQGLGKIPGVSAAFVALVAYNAIQIGVYGLFGVGMGAFFGPKLGIELSWWLWAFIGWAGVATLGVLRVELNAKVLAVAMVLECVLVVLFDVAGLLNPASGSVTFDAFDPSVGLGTAVGAGLTFVFLTFFGFEQAAIYGEEAKDPRRTIPRATRISLAILAGFYAISSWLFGVAAGPDTITSADGLLGAGFATGGAPDPTVTFFALGTAHLGTLWGDVASLLYCSSLFAAILAFHNAISRYFFALGREGVLPRQLGHVSQRTGAPVYGSLAQSAIALVVFSAFALAGKDPVLTLFTWLPALGAIGLVLLLAATAFAIVRFFARHPDTAESRWATFTAPLISGVLLFGLFVTMLANFNVLITGSTEAPTDSLTYVLPAILFGAGVVGALVGLSLKLRGAPAYAAIGTGRAAGAASAADGWADDQPRVGIAVAAPIGAAPTAGEDRIRSQETSEEA